MMDDQKNEFFYPKKALKMCASKERHLLNQKSISEKKASFLLTFCSKKMEQKIETRQMISNEVKCFNKCFQIQFSID